jgi:hypothetical protein
MEQTQTLPHSLYLSLYKPFIQSRKGGGKTKKGEHNLSISSKKRKRVKRELIESIDSSLGLFQAKVSQFGLFKAIIHPIRYLQDHWYVFL